MSYLYSSYFCLLKDAWGQHIVNRKTIARGNVCIYQLDLKNIETILYCTKTYSVKAIYTSKNKWNAQESKWQSHFTVVVFFVLALMLVNTNRDHAVHVSIWIATLNAIPAPLPSTQDSQYIPEPREEFKVLSICELTSLQQTSPTYTIHIRHRLRSFCWLCKVWIQPRW